jgi:hypothetical protein
MDIDDIVRIYCYCRSSSYMGKWMWHITRYINLVLQGSDIWYISMLYRCVSHVYHARHKVGTYWTPPCRMIFDIPTRGYYKFLIQTELPIALDEVSGYIYGSISCDK